MQETEARLLAAALDELNEVGAEALTIRNVATRAGVSPATAYNHLASKQHLFAELYLRHLQEHRKETFRARTPLTRVQELLREQADHLGQTPALAAAATWALLSTEADVERLRIKVGVEMLDGFQAALGEADDDNIREALVLAYTGALLQAGMGLMTYAELADRVQMVAATIMKGHV